MSVDAKLHAHRVSDEAQNALLAQDPGRAVLAALQLLLDRDLDLLLLDANERAITHRFAMYLQDELPEWQVDCEYNRDGHNPKRVNLPHLYPADDDTEGTTVFPDVIVHHRGREDNYLVIEFKKMKHGYSDEVDKQKLHAYKAELNYTFTLFIAVGVEGRCGEIHVEWIE
jgi:hypothetical protein